MSILFDAMIENPIDVTFDGEFVGSGAPADLKLLCAKVDEVNERIALDWSLSYAVDLETLEVLPWGAAKAEDESDLWAREKISSKGWYSFEYLNRAFGEGTVDRLRHAAENFEAIEADPERKLTRNDLLWVEPGKEGLITFDFHEYRSERYCMINLTFFKCELAGRGSGSYKEVEEKESPGKVWSLAGMASAKLPAAAKAPAKTPATKVRGRGQ